MNKYPFFEFIFFQRRSQEKVEERSNLSEKFFFIEITHFFLPKFSYLAASAEPEAQDQNGHRRSIPCQSSVILGGKPPDMTTRPLDR